MNFFLDRIAIVDLASASVVFQPLPEPALQNRDLACLGEIFADSLVFAAGRLTGSLAPASCLLTARCGDKTCLLKGHFGPALRRCGLDALVLCGKATRPSGLALTEQGIRLLDAESGADAPTQRAALLRAVRQEHGADDDILCVVTGSAAFAHCASPALVWDHGLAPRSALAAHWMAEHNLVGLCLHGASPYLSPLPLDNAGRAAAPSVLLTAAEYGKVLQAARPGTPTHILPVGRSLACHACPAPCQCWLPGPQGFVAATSPEAVALLLEKGASARRVAEIFLLAERFGLEPLGLAGLATTADVPKDVLSHVQAVDEASPDPSVGKGMLLGICPFFLRRFPAVRAALEGLAVGTDDKTR
ncbi:MAG: hypothetical protein IJU37_05025 [Desulfovibrio sp.]|nr:hypothetical protein [Desulfovibrio sp.]